MSVLMKRIFLIGTLISIMLVSILYFTAGDNCIAQAMVH